MFAGVSAIAEAHRIEKRPRDPAAWFNEAEFTEWLCITTGKEGMLLG
jgi:hypothetical protein